MVSLREWETARPDEGSLLAQPRQCLRRPLRPFSSKATLSEKL